MDSKINKAEAIARSLSVFGIRSGIKTASKVLTELHVMDNHFQDQGRAVRQEERERITQRLEDYREALRIKLGDNNAG
tara:strand:- start:56 stop:289 length:234 start_codon:yes stop_codon:yes gene_type:complete